MGAAASGVAAQGVPIVVVLQWRCSGVAVVLQWCCSGVAVVLQWYCSGVEAQEAPILRSILYSA
jgi:hypothetical protein